MFGHLLFDSGAIFIWNPRGIRSGFFGQNPRPSPPVTTGGVVGGPCFGMLHRSQGGYNCVTLKGQAQARAGKAVACLSSPGRLIRGVVHRHQTAVLGYIKEVVVSWWAALGPSPNHQPPAQTSLWSVSHSLYTGRPHTRAATRPLAPPRHLSNTWQPQDKSKYWPSFFLRPTSNFPIDFFHAALQYLFSVLSSNQKPNKSVTDRRTH